MSRRVASRYSLREVQPVWAPAAVLTTGSDDQYERGQYR